MVNTIKKILSIILPVRMRVFFIKKMYKFILKGDNYICPICKKAFITFLPFGNGRYFRVNAMCPNERCESLERHRLLWLFLLRETDLFANKKKILHVAPEKALFYKLKKQKNIEYVCCDKFCKGYKYPSCTLNIDITDIDMKDNLFDVIICNHVLEHIPEDSLALQELRRILKPGGFAIVQVPVELEREATYEDDKIVSEQEREKYFGHKEHVRIYGRDFKKRLEINGFVVQEINYQDKLSEKDKKKYSLSGDIIYFLKGSK